MFFFTKDSKQTTENQKTCAARISKSSTSMRLFLDGDLNLFWFYTQKVMARLLLSYTKRGIKAKTEHTLIHRQTLTLHVRCDANPTKSAQWIRLKVQTPNEAPRARSSVVIRVLQQCNKNLPPTNHPPASLSHSLYTRPAQALIFRARNGTQFTHIRYIVYRISEHTHP